MQTTTLGREILRQDLEKLGIEMPEELNKKTIKNILSDVAANHPDRYVSMTRRLTGLARQSAQETGFGTFALEHLRQSPAAVKRLQNVRAQMQRALEVSSLVPGSDEDLERRMVELASENQKPMQDEVLAESIAAGNPLSDQVVSGARGKPANLNALRGADLLYDGPGGRKVPIPITRSYSQGLSPSQYLAASYGARMGTVDTKLATADTGYACLAEGEMVRMADGSTKPIQCVEKGDQVLGANTEGLTFPVEVVNTFDHGAKECWKYQFDGGRPGSERVCIRATEDHKVLSSYPSADRGTNGQNPLSLCEKTGFALQYPQGPDQDQDFRGTYVGKDFLGLVPTYDIEVDHPDHLFVLANNAIVSNSKTINRAMHRLAAIEPDDIALSRLREELKHRGLMVDVDDPDNEGAVLLDAYGDSGKLSDTGSESLGRPLSPRAMQALRRKGFTRLRVASPVAASQPVGGGIYRQVLGLREGGRNPEAGELVGMTAAGSLSEGLTQGALCLAEGTQVQMFDGSRKAIEDIQVGDEVWGCDRQANISPCTVTDTFVSGQRDCYEFTYFDGADFKSVTCTPHHKVLSSERDAKSGLETLEPRPIGETQDMLVCSDVPAGSKVAVLGEDDRVGVGMSVPLMKASSRVEHQHAGVLNTYDIEVDHPDHFFVLANGMVVSNSAKHSGGVAGESKNREGFPLIQRLLNPSVAAPDQATHAQLDGPVTAVSEASGGGYNVRIGNKDHYVAPGLEVKVKAGQSVEAGETISGGVPSTGQIVAHQGVGEGRKRLVELLREAYQGVGTPVHRRNLELLATGLIDHVELTEPTQSGSPGDMVSYGQLERDWEPREEAFAFNPGKQVPKHLQSKTLYLEKPTLHYSIGTRITPRVRKELSQAQVGEVLVYDKPPPFRPVMQRAQSALQNDADWMARMYGTHLSRSVLEAAHRGRDSDTAGGSFVPSLAEAKDFDRFAGDLAAPRG